ncbi:MAG: Dipeptide transport system permease protein DppC [uncultured Truepera sp.]|uniref:Dipeptide transport system permease protein DppC n=1 Tax=uncultured Truepera sp. TaxID=543023 RepID=A0A6J4VF57_9DEIN|nr:MAG: Dipeptide transport system permease protein DppC [uncultured Truepera sp.]
MTKAVAEPRRTVLFKAVPLNLALGAVLIGIVIISALVSFVWLPHDPNAMDFTAQLSGPSAAHPLGTDHLGRDLLSRVLVGSRGALFVGFVAVGIALTLGCLVGAVAGFVGGLLDDILMRLVDVLYAFPPILLALLLAAIYAPGTLTAMSAIGLATAPTFARLLRASVLELKNRDFVEAGRALGATQRRLLLRHILPNALSPIIVQTSLSLAVAVLAEAALSFLGLGTPPRTPSWGTMLREAQGFLQLSPYPVLVPGFAIVMTVLGWSLLGDGIRDARDPRNL